MTESYVLCEGFHDRAFWAGMLLTLGCSDPGLRTDGSRTTVFDPWSLPVRGDGEFAYRSKSGRFVRLVPAKGKDKLIPLARNRLKTRDQKALLRLVIVADADTNADGTLSTGSPVSYAAIKNLILSTDPSATEANNDFVIDDGAGRVSFVRWQPHDPPTPGVPNQHTLERMISAAMVAAFPSRGTCVQTWLDSRLHAPLTTPKSYGWSYLAGWHSDFSGYEAFLSGLWENPKIVATLKPRLEQCGVWRIAEALAA
jgi:hypothetical protein